MRKKNLLPENSFHLKRRAFMFWLDHSCSDTEKKSKMLMWNWIYISPVNTYNSSAYSQLHELKSVHFELGKFEHKHNYTPYLCIHRKSWNVYIVNVIPFFFLKHSWSCYCCRFSTSDCAFVCMQKVTHNSNTHSLH